MQGPIVNGNSYKKIIWIVLELSWTPVAPYILCVALGCRASGKL